MALPPNEPTKEASRAPRLDTRLDTRRGIVSMVMILKVARIHQINLTFFNKVISTYKAHSTFNHCAPWYNTYKRRKMSVDTILIKGGRCRLIKVLIILFFYQLMQICKYNKHLKFAILNPFNFYLCMYTL